MTGENKADQRAGDHANQFGSVSGGHISISHSISNVVSHFGVWSFLGIVSAVSILGITAVFVVAIIVTDGDGGDDGDESRHVVTSGGLPGSNQLPFDPLPTQTPGPVPTFPPTPTETPPPPALPPESTGCPFRATALWLPHPNTDYGPFFYAGIEYYLHFDMFSIYASNSSSYFFPRSVQYEEPIASKRNEWLSLSGNEPLVVCVDTAGRVYADFE